MAMEPLDHFYAITQLLRLNNGKCYDHSSALIFNEIFILACIEGNYNISVEFDFGLQPPVHFWVACH